jgi:CheY-like chemotaxis protein
MREFEPVAQAKGLTFAVNLAPGSPEHLVTDGQRLRQILGNLLANALKFTEQGGVHLEVTTPVEGWSPESRSLTSAESVVALAISDTGIGIAADQQRRIFEAFAQGDGTTARTYGGTGLGLSISRELVGLLGGEIDVTSVPGEGSTFTVYLPAGAVALAPPNGSAAPPNGSAGLSNGAATASAEASPTLPAVTAGPERGTVVGQGDREARRAPAISGVADDLDGVKVLVVDDDFRNIFAMTALLERGRANVSVAESGQEALATLQRVRDIDIVLMDIMMPVMDGYATIRAIRSFEHFKSLPIIAVTGKVIVGERERCLEAGADDFVPKPVDTAELLAVLKPWLPATEATPA